MMHLRAIGDGCGTCLRWFAAPLLLALVLQSCASPSGKLDRLAKDQGFVRSTLVAGGFRLRVYQNTAAQLRASNRTLEPESITLHVYLEGDGSPWRYRTIIMPDPTPRRPLMLRLMRQDAQPAAYLGRPCYNGTSLEDSCDNSLWTSGRYSLAVVQSMASGLRVLARQHRADRLWLLGHSGGGALAMLLAEQVPEVRRVVTVAGNLDTSAWTRHHGYTPLYGSANPADQVPYRRDLWQWHLLGGQDDVIPQQLVRPFIMRQSHASAFLIDRFSHGCCWLSIWPQVLVALEQDDPTQIPGRQFKFRDDVLEASDSL
ncbi:MAG: alpha/beta hydrolase [Granulosicoccus sp.]|nr:alpha/beta hydrolase [Granulosicoccus sp.]